MGFVRCLALVLSASCAGDEPTGVSGDVGGSTVGAYSFFVAGHVYGKPGGDTVGLYPAFKARLPWLLEQAGMSLGFLAGDMVRRPNGRFWDQAALEIDEIGVPVHMVAGNHDIAYEGAEGGPDLIFRAGYEERFGPTYYSRRYAGDLFLVFDTTLDHWNVSGPQLELLQRELTQGSFRNLFVFFHHVVWWRNADGANLRPNSWDGRSDGTPNFWSEVAPLLTSTGREVFVFAGDLGAHKKATPFSYRREGALHLIATGMGGGTQDNCVVVDVDVSGAVHPRLVALAGEPDSLGELRDL
ncbi:MAG: hypothetical protein ACI8QZ_001317 [Chlamydiales bacterium]|jgi:hypothetical protein